jgi:holin-like protein
MLCLVLLLYLKIIPVEYVEDGANLLLDNMSLLFIPVIVGATVYFGLLPKMLLL